MQTTVSHMKEEAKFEQDAKALGWFMLDTLENCVQPNRVATYYTKQIIIAKLRVGNYSRSNYIGTKLLAEEYAKIASKEEEKLTKTWWEQCNYYYSKGSNGEHYRTEQDEVIEVTTGEELKDRYSSCVNYIDDFMTVSNARRNLMCSQ